MVSKSLKKTPKSIKNTTTHHHHHRRKKSPVKQNLIVKSIYTCHRRLVKIFSKLTKLTTTPNRHKKGFQILKKLPDDYHVRRPLFSPHHPLPPMSSPEKKTIILDLDETLVHSQPYPPPNHFDFIVQPKIDNEIMNFYVLKRPGVDELLESLSKKFEIVIFTAGLEEYASLVLDRLDRNAVIAHRLYRDSCKEFDGKFVKDLSGLGRDLKRVVIIDDNPNAYVFQPENAIPVRPFLDDERDNELHRLIEFFDGCDGFEDMRDAVKKYVADGNFKSEL